MNESSSQWWKEAVFYQVYPLSFADSNGDGFGDLAGVESRLDYLKWLGIDALWLSPFYQSPMRDWGYDVSNHKVVDPRFGNLADFDQFLESAHNRGLRIIIDLIINHTSDQHEWFRESRASLDNPKRAWYVWRSGDPSNPPNNWVSVFSGPAWSWDALTGEWYRNTYLPDQPDLNWRNPEVVEAILGVMRFWLDRGVDGFRVDGAHQIMKDPLERDNPPVARGYVNPYKDMGEYGMWVHLHDVGDPDVHGAHQKMRALLDSYPGDRMAVSEIHEFDPAEWISYFGHDDELTMPFNYQLMVADWTADAVSRAVKRVEGVLPVWAWTNWTMGNHDEIRVTTRLGEQQARQAAVLLLTLRGSPFLYYGDELAMLNGDPQGRDPWGRSVSFLSRDGCRTPMQWDSSSDAGFGSTDPWIPLGPEASVRNVDVETKHDTSMLNLYHELLMVRRQRISLRLGSFRQLEHADEGVFAFQRQYEDERTLVVINFGDHPVEWPVVAGDLLAATVLPDSEGKLGAHQAAVFTC